MTGKPIFERRHYVAIAYALSELPAVCPGDCHCKQCMRLRFQEQLANVFAADNPAFDRRRFAAACAGKSINGRMN